MFTVWEIFQSSRHNHVELGGSDFNVVVAIALSIDGNGCNSRL
jgi:hypothetical protein